MSEHTPADYQRMLLERASEIEVRVLYRKAEGLKGYLAQCAAAWSSFGCQVRLTEDPFGGFIPATRNNLVYRFLRGSKKYLLFVDSDVCPITPNGDPDPAAALRMAQRDKPVISGCACGIHHERGVFVCVVMKDDKGQGRWLSENDTESIPMDGISPIENCGTGFLMIRRDVLETLMSRSVAMKREEKVQELIQETVKLGYTDRGAKEFSEKWLPFLESIRHAHDDDGLPFTVPQSVLSEAAKTGFLPRGEDICFTDRVRKAGFDIYVDWSAHCVHFKEMGIQFDQSRRLDIDSANWKIKETALSLAEVG